MRTLLLLACLCLATPPANAAGKRVAVVVGVGAYQAVPQLANPPRDARAIADALRRLGFDTTLVLDPDRAALEQAIRTLGDHAGDADAALFFFAGHGVEANGHNALVPVSARIAGPRDMAFETVDLDLVLDQTEGRARTILIFLDACRDNPFQHTLSGGGRGVASGRGLAEPASDVTGTLIAFATAPGRTAKDGDGQDSPFTTALLRHIETPGLEVNQLLELVRKDVRLATNGEQIPWDSSALEQEFYFRPAAPGSAPGPTPGAGADKGAAAGAPSDKGARSVAGDVHCHVPRLTGRLRVGAGATGTMQVTSTGRGCGFTVWRRPVDKVPYDALTLATAPRHGTVTFANDHRIVYAPEKGFVGADTFAVASTPKGIVTMQVEVRAPDK